MTLILCSAVVVLWLLSFAGSQFWEAGKTLKVLAEGEYFNEDKNSMENSVKVILYFSIRIISVVVNVKRSRKRTNSITRHATFMQLYTFSSPLQSSLHAPFPLVHCTILTVSWFDLCPSFFTFSEMLLCFLKPCKDNCFVGVPSGCYSHLSSHFPLASFFR